MKLIAILLIFLSQGFAAFAIDKLDGASWRKDGSGSGIAALTGRDGVTRTVAKGGRQVLTVQEGTTPPSSYLYFRVADDRLPGYRQPLYVLVEFYDDTMGGVLTLNYDSATGDAIEDKYRTADNQAGGYSVGAKRFKTVCFVLKQPRFAHRQNNGADFRLTGTRMYIRSIKMTHIRPANWDKLDTLEKIDIKPLVHIGESGQFIVGGFDPAKASDAPGTVKALEASIPALKSLGVTSHEVYVRWRLCELQPGKFDWSVYDRYVAVYKRFGLKWVPFIVVGSPYSLPDWYYKKPGSQGYVCLEHGLESDVQSLWNPELRKHVSRFLKAFCDHYRDSGVIESILLGITGNYGEAIYPATGNDWTADVHGPYHTHPGLWAGDKYAIESFRLWLIHKYGGATPLRDAWGVKAADINTIKPVLKRDAPNERAWLDQCEWYIGSMTSWAKFWLTETRKNFLKGDIYLCTGGHAPVEHGSNFGDQCRAASEVNAGVRITNEGSDYKGNFSLTRWVASAGRQYGAYFSFEPAGEVNPNGVVARIYNATASGAKGLHYYYPNLFATDAARGNFVKWGHQFKQRKPVVEIAAYYPETYIMLNDNDFLGYVQPLRDRFDFDYMSDEQILDGGLKKIKALILLEGNISEDGVWRRITAWVRAGGLLVYPTGMGELRTVESGDQWNNALLGPGADLGKGGVATFEGLGKSQEYRQFVTDQLRRLPALSLGTRAMLANDGEEDGVFATFCDPNELLWLNYTNTVVKRDGSVLPPYSIVSTFVKNEKK